jgi:NAD(P)-dependent dehydrogenase (short-subunit alcohol dehydrogenase family)
MAAEGNLIMSEGSSLENRWVLVTGGSRGVGKETVIGLAREGYHVMFLYREKESRANQVAEQALREGVAGVRIIPLQCDITDPVQRLRMNGHLTGRGIRLSGLVLAASGGLEPGKGDDYSMLINRDAQVAMLEQCWDRSREHFRVVYDTSHWAHWYGEVEQLPGYTPIAASKHAGELALQQRFARLEAENPRQAEWVVITGDMLRGSTVANLLNRRSGGDIIAAREAVIGKALPTSEEMALANVRAISSPESMHKQLIVIGGEFSTLTPITQ